MRGDVARVGMMAMVVLGVAVMMVWMPGTATALPIPDVLVSCHKPAVVGEWTFTLGKNTWSAAGTLTE